MNMLRALWVVGWSTFDEGPNSLISWFVLAGLVITCPITIPYFFVRWIYRSFKVFGERVIKESKQIEIKTKKRELEAGQLSPVARVGGELSKL